MTEIHNHLKGFLQSLVKEPITDWSALESILTLKKIKKGDHFFQHFDECNEVAIVSSGMFRIYLTDSEGEEKTFSFYPENSFILDFFLTNEVKVKTDVSVQAIEDSEIFTLKYSSLLALMETNRVWHTVYREVLLRNYIFKTKREIQFVQFNAKERINRFIKNGRFDFERIPKTYLASFLGIQPSSLSRLLREFKES